MVSANACRAAALGLLGILTVASLASTRSAEDDVNSSSLTASTRLSMLRRHRQEHSSSPLLQVRLPSALQGSGSIVNFNAVVVHDLEYNAKAYVQVCFMLSRNIALPLLGLPIPCTLPSCLSQQPTHRRQVAGCVCRSGLVAHQLQDTE